MRVVSLAHHPADWTPVLVVTAGTGAAFVPLVADLSAYTLAPLWVVSLLARSVAPVHQHCHAHYRIFRRWSLNAAYDAILALAAGNVTAVWELQHVVGHHRHYLAGAGDPAHNHRFGRSRLVFAVLGDALSFTDSLALARTRPHLRARLWRQQLALLAAAAVLVAIDPAVTLAWFVGPWLLLRWMVFWFSHAQHADVPMTDVYSGSVTHFGWTNRFYLNVGHHTAHHEKPTLHWTRLPARTAHILERIPPSCLR